MFDKLFTQYRYATLIAMAAILFFGLYALQSNHDTQVKEYKQGMYSNQIEQHVAADAEAQYDIVKRNNGSLNDLCVYAGMVAAAYLQAGDEPNYVKWKNIEDNHKKELGL